MRSGRADVALSEFGDTIIEVLIALTIMGFAVAGLLPMVASTVSSADRLKKHARVTQVMSEAVAAVQAEPWRADCNYALMLSAVSSAPDPTILTSLIAHWDPSTKLFVAGCPDPAAPSLSKTILVRLTVETPDHRSSQTLEVTKRP